MKIKINIILIIVFLIPNKISAQEYAYILNDKCINELFSLANNEFINSDIETIRDARGIILRLNMNNINNNFYYNIKKIEYFLAKIENPAIIEVHTGDFSEEKLLSIKKWEFSTIIANDIEAVITEPKGSIPQKRINSVGYGEFLPAKNTPNNGGKLLNRIDIIVLCNISGE